MVFHTQQNKTGLANCGQFWAFDSVSSGVGVLWFTADCGHSVGASCFPTVSGKVMILKKEKENFNHFSISRALSKIHKIPQRCNYFELVSAAWHASKTFCST